MNTSLKWHGCLTFAVVLAAAAPVPGEIIAVPARRFELELELNSPTATPNNVELWFTSDRGATWQVLSSQFDGPNRLTTEAPHEGLLGLFAVATNSTGPSSHAPSPSTAPHAWILVDFTPPVVQLHAARLVQEGRRRTIRFHWTAIDAHFGARPATLEFRRLPSASWQAINTEPMANTGRFDWAVPDGISGGLAVRVSVFDQVGHRAWSEELTTEIPPAPDAAAPPAETTPSAPGERPAVHRVEPFVPVDDAATPGSLAAKLRAQELFNAGLASRDSGDFRSAVTAFRSAIRLDPQNATAFAEMGDALYRLGEFGHARESFELALTLSPISRGALRGLARIEAQNRNYDRAVDLLRTILRRNPNDAEVWLNLGDLAVFQGNESLARESYLRAGQIDPDAAEIVGEARRRLELMAAASRDSD